MELFVSPQNYRCLRKCANADFRHHLILPSQQANKVEERISGLSTPLNGQIHFRDNVKNSLFNHVKNIGIAVDDILDK